MRVAALSLLVVLACARAYAQSPALTPPRTGLAEPVETGQRGYARDVLIADGIGVALLVGGLAFESEGVATLGITSLVFTTPIVHAVKGHGGRTVASLALRIALPLTGAIVAVDELDENVVLGGALGGVAATGIDLLISHYGAHDEPTTVTPSVSRSLAGDGTATYGLVGRF
jgi:hypothetical protein